jgi:hypothetical protein
VVHYSVQLLFKFRPDKYLASYARNQQRSAGIADLHLKCPSLLSDINNNKNWPVLKNFRKLPDIEFHENPFRGSLIVTREQTARDKPKPEG